MTNPTDAIKALLRQKFPAFHPDGPCEMGFPEGSFYVRKCPDCGEENGGAIFNEKHTRESANKDKYDPVNQPCLWCKKGPPVWELVCESGESEA